VAWFAALAALVPAAAAEVGGFYSGRLVEVVIGMDVGGGYDSYSRLVGRYLGKYIPGNPSFIPENMTGAGSRTAANWLYNVAARDGSVIGTLTEGTPLDQARKQPGIQFDATKFNWIGNPIVDNQVTLAFAASGLATLEDVKAKGGLICGGTGASTPPIIFPRIINQILGTNIRVIPGYPGAGAMVLAMQRGEINCLGAHSWAATKATMPNLLADHKLNVLVQWGPTEDPDISAYAGHHVPLIDAYARSDADRRVLELMNAVISIGRPLVAPPGLPAERVAALRQAFDEVMEDVDFRAEAKRLGLDIKPIGGENLQKVVMKVVEAPADTVARVNDFIDPQP
jgi:tripartite-type tricarboxylate transporter receptor subunit TctC